MGIYFPDEDIEARTLFVLSSTVVGPKLAFHLTDILARLINVKGTWERGITQLYTTQRPEELFT